MGALWREGVLHEILGVVLRALVTRFFAIAAREIFVVLGVVVGNETLGCGLLFSSIGGGLASDVLLEFELALSEQESLLTHGELLLFTLEIIFCVRGHDILLPQDITSGTGQASWKNGL